MALGWLLRLVVQLLRPGGISDFEESYFNEVQPADDLEAAYPAQERGPRLWR